MSGIENFKCPNCGGAIEFDPNAQKLKCPYCSCEFDVEATINSQTSLPSDNMVWQSQPKETYSETDDKNVVTYVCSSCGGSIICDTNTAATTCPYCNSKVVLSGNVEGDLKPNYIIPFKLDKNSAKTKYLEHLKGKFFLPKVFKDENHINELTGLYVPFWLFDADADATIRYRATKTRVWSDKEYNYTETSFFLCNRSGTVTFNHVPVDGSIRMDNQLMESIEPFDFTEAVPFNTAYFAGFVADKYDVSSDDTISRANERVKVSTEDAFRDTVVGYTSVNVQDSYVSMENGSASYAMYPVYILNTTWNDKNYMFAMNGQTGKFVGNLPINKGKLFGFLFGLGIGLSALIYAVRWIIELLRFGGVI